LVELKTIMTGQEGGLTKTATDRTDPNSDPYRVMLVDDSAVTRGLLSRILESDPQVVVTSSVGDGQMAINAMRRTPVDVIVLDLEMPVMDGMTALPRLLEIDPAVKVIVVSTMSRQGAEITMRALQLGAAECVEKPSSNRELTSASDFKLDVLRKVKILAAEARRGGVRSMDIDRTKVVKVPSASTMPSKRSSSADIKLRQAVVIRPDAIAIGSSTGGPQALFEVLSHFAGFVRQPIFITQHMPGTFTAILAAHITRQCKIDCVEAQNMMPVENNKVYVAAGGFHMLIQERGGQNVIMLSQDPPENFCRPSVDPMLRSLVKVYGKKLLVAILTGMGQDGLKGCQQVVEAGGTIIAQDEASSVVWGMPGVVATGGLCTAVLPIADIGPHIRGIAGKGGL